MMHKFYFHTAIITHHQIVKFCSCFQDHRFYSADLCPHIDHLPVFSRRHTKRFSIIMEYLHHQNSN
jgi:hypothetical protein